MGTPLKKTNRSARTRSSRRHLSAGRDTVPAQQWGI